MMISTKADFARALERLRGRDPESLAAFIVSLAQDSGPIGEQVRTFIVGDDVAETVESLRARIGALRIPEEYEHRHARGREMGASLEFIVESIESLVMPVDPKRAFELLVLLPGFKFFFPITRMLIVSAVVSLIAWLMRR
jgi:hypothetical protein